MIRTEADFAKAFDDAKSFVKRHNKPIWIVPREKDYAISVIPPKPEQLPSGTAAVQYGINMNQVDSIKSTT